MVGTWRINMALDIGHLVVCGDINATTRNTIHGWIGLRDRESQSMIEFTGNAEGELAGHRVRFEARDDRMAVGYPFRELRSFPDHSIGVVKRADLQCGDDGVYTLHLEWYGQGGHTLVRLDTPYLEVDPEGYESPEFGRDPADMLPGDYQSLAPGSAPPPEGEDFVADLRMFDDLIESNAPGIRIGSLFDEYGLAPPEELDEEGARTALERILGTLALFGVAFHMCPKCTWHHAYGLVYHKLSQEHFHPELKGTGWIQNFLAIELCPFCVNEFDEEEHQDNLSHDLDESSNPFLRS